jgi:hypothetical protein
MQARPFYSVVKNGHINEMVKLTRNVFLRRAQKIYFDQPFVSETMRCVSNNFIETNDSSGQNELLFYV